MTNDRVPMTREGYEKLKGEVEQMQNVRMPELDPTFSRSVSGPSSGAAGAESGGGRFRRSSMPAIATCTAPNTPISRE